MKFEEYMSLRGGGALCPSEARAFGIELTKNWKKRNKGLELSNEQIVKACAALSSSNSKFKARSAKILSKLTKDEMPVKQEDEQYLYLMCNVIGLYKIGISVDPEERANQVKNSSGVPVAVVAVWRTSCEARAMESLLHKEFSKFRQQGEWFSFPSDPTRYIELCMRASHYSATKLYENRHAIKAMDEIRNRAPETNPWTVIRNKGWYVDLFDL